MKAFNAKFMLLIFVIYSAKKLFKILITNLKIEVIFLLGSYLFLYLYINSNQINIKLYFQDLYKQSEWRVGAEGLTSLDQESQGQLNQVWTNFLENDDNDINIVNANTINITTIFSKTAEKCIMTTCWHDACKIWRLVW